MTDYFWEQLDIFMDPQAREKQMKMDETVDIIRKRFGFYSVREGLCTATEYCQHVMQSLIIRYIRMGTLDRQED